MFGILKLLMNEEKTKMWNSSLLLQKKRENVQEENRGDAEARFLKFLERDSTFSLDFRLIRPSDFFGPRSKVVLRGEGNAWTPVLGVFDNFHEVGYFPTWFIFSLKAL